MKVPDDFPHLWDHKEKRRVADWFAAHELIDLREKCPCRVVATNGDVYCDSTSVDAPDICESPCPVLAARKETT